MDKLNAVLDEIKGYKSVYGIKDAKKILQAVIDDLKAKRTVPALTTDFIKGQIDELQVAMGRLS